MGREVEDANDLVSQLKERGFDVSEYIQLKRDAREDGRRDAALRYVQDYAGISAQEELGANPPSPQEELPLYSEGPPDWGDDAFDYIEPPVEDDYLPEVDLSEFKDEMSVARDAESPHADTPTTTKPTVNSEDSLQNTDPAPQPSSTPETLSHEDIEQLDDELLDFEPPPSWLDEVFGYDDPSLENTSPEVQQEVTEGSSPTDELKGRVVNAFEQAPELDSRSDRRRTEVPSRS